MSSTRRTVFLATAWAAWLLLASHASAATLNFDYSYDQAGSDFFGTNPTAKTALEAAGSFFSANLTDDLDAIVAGGVNHWTAVFNNPDTGSTVNDANRAIAADTIDVIVGARDLGGGTLGRGGPGGFSASGTSGWLEKVSTRGEGDTSGSDAVDFGPWGGSLTFDIDSTWHFDHTTAPVAGASDFYSVALHELAHLLGFGTSDSWEADVLSASDDFTGPAAAAEYGGNVPLDADESHWKPGTMSTVFGGGAVQEAAMDPNILVGTRKVMTDLDMAALTDIGWQVVPEPITLALLSLGATALLRRRAA